MAQKENLQTQFTILMDLFFFFLKQTTNDKEVEACTHQARN